MTDQAYPFPVYRVSACSSDWLLRTVVPHVARRGPLAYPRYVARMDDFMGPRPMNSKRCLAQQACSPLGGFSVWGFSSLAPPGQGHLSSQAGALGSQASAARQTILVSTAMDASAFFHDRAFGAQSTVSGLVALLATADALAHASPPPTEKPLSKTVAFAAFQGERFGFSGSRRFTNDLDDVGAHAAKGGACAVEARWRSPDGVGDLLNNGHREVCVSPLRSSLEYEKLVNKSAIDVAADGPSFDLVLDVQQVGRSFTEGGALHLHGADQAQRDLLLQTFAAVRAEVDAPPLPTVHSGSVHLPPSTATAFLQGSTDRAGSAAAGAVLGGFGDAYGERYGSEFDDGVSNPIDATAVADTATLVARAVHALAGGRAADRKEIVADVGRVKSMIACFAQARGCEMMKEYGLYEFAQRGPISMYTSVFPQPFMSTMTKSSGFWDSLLGTTRYDYSVDLASDNSNVSLKDAASAVAYWHLPTTGRLDEAPPHVVIFRFPSAREVTFC